MGKVIWVMLYGDLEMWGEFCCLAIKGSIRMSEPMAETRLKGIPFPGWKLKKLNAGCC